MHLLLSSEDGTLKVRVQAINSFEIRDPKTKRAAGVNFIANGEHALYTDATLQKRPSNVDEAKALIAETQAILVDFEKAAADAAAEKEKPAAPPPTTPAPTAPPAEPSEFKVPAAGYAGEPS